MHNCIYIRIALHVYCLPTLDQLYVLCDCVASSMCTFWHVVVMTWSCRGRAQREAMLTMAHLQHRPDLLQLSLELMAMLEPAV